MKETKRELTEALAEVNWSILFLVLLILGILLSFAATVEERNGLELSLCARQEEPVDVFSLRWPASVLVTGGTGFFAWLACRSMKDALASEDCAQRRSSAANLLAAWMVFGAALLRLANLAGE